MRSNPSLPNAVERIYNWIDRQVKKQNSHCNACGKCCDFANYDHKLFVTTPELIHFAEKLGEQSIKQMKTGRCPYNTNGKCTVYDHRFAGCRIFFCEGDTELQNKLSEEALKRFKTLCRRHNISYQYLELPTALNHCKSL